jgi:hypothetical protein
MAPSDVSVLTKHMEALAAEIAQDRAIYKVSFREPFVRKA